MAKKRCQYCGRLFVHDPRVGDRQKACSFECQKLRKKENNKAFSRGNPGYWHGRYEYVKEWRQKNPNYQRLWRQKKKQSDSSNQGEIQAEIGEISFANQDVMRALLCEIQVYIECFRSSDRKLSQDEREDTSRTLQKCEDT